MINYPHIKLHHVIHSPSSTNHKTRTSPIPPMSARSHPRSYPDIRNTTTNMTKTGSSLHLIPINAINQPSTFWLVGSLYLVSFRLYSRHLFPSSFFGAYILSPISPFSKSLNLGVVLETLHLVPLTDL
jgi:hypothetical protein